MLLCYCLLMSTNSVISLLVGELVLSCVWHSLNNYHVLICTHYVCLVVYLIVIVFWKFGNYRYIKCTPFILQACISFHIRKCAKLPILKSYQSCCWANHQKIFELPIIPLIQWIAGFSRCLLFCSVLSMAVCKS